jgi:hypothetical protein
MSHHEVDLHLLLSASRPSRTEVTPRSFSRLSRRTCGWAIPRRALPPRSTTRSHTRQDLRGAGHLWLPSSPARSRRRTRPDPILRRSLVRACVARGLPSPCDRATGTPSTPPCRPRSWVTTTPEACPSRATRRRKKAPGQDRPQHTTEEETPGPGSPAGLPDGRWLSATIARSVLPRNVAAGHDRSRRPSAEEPWDPCPPARSPEPETPTGSPTSSPAPRSAHPAPARAA